jgi:hypothetical protein
MLPVVTKLVKYWALEEISKFLYVTDQIVPNMSGSGIVYVGTVQRGSEPEAASLAHVVEQIIDRVLPGSGTSLAPQPGRTRAGLIARMGRPSHGYAAT